MNCKPGDIARIVLSVDGNVDKLVSVERDSGSRDDGTVWWVCVALQPVNSHERVSLPGTRLFCADRALRPIRDQPGEDETLTWAGKPEQVIA